MGPIPSLQLMMLSKGIEADKDQPNVLPAANKVKPLDKLANSPEQQQKLLGLNGQNANGTTTSEAYGPIQQQTGQYPASLFS